MLRNSRLYWSDLKDQLQGKTLREITEEVERMPGLNYGRQNYLFNDEHHKDEDNKY